MQAPLILAHDVGTSGTKSSLVGADGVILASQTSPQETQFPRPNWAQQRPADWWEGVCRNTRALTARHSALRRQIVGIGVSGHMLGCLPVDSKGKALHPSMIHSDFRAVDPCEIVHNRIGRDAVYELTGNILDSRSSLCKVLWLKANEPDVYQRTARFLQSKDYVVGRMIGSYDSTDYSDASHAQWLDIRAKSYATDMFVELGIDSAKFPALHRSTDQVGKLTRESAEALDLPAGIPVVAGGGRRLLCLGRGRSRTCWRHLLLSRHHGLDCGHDCRTVYRRTATHLQRSWSRRREKRGLRHGPSRRPLSGLGHGPARRNGFRSLR